MPPRALAAPLHRHNREDEYSFVLEGRMGALLGDDVVEAGPGDLVYKPRGQWHTFWNAGDEPARILEIISPAGFEQFFAELAPLAAGGAPDPEAFGELCAPLRARHAARDPARALRPLRTLVPGRRVARPRRDTPRHERTQRARRGVGALRDGAGHGLLPRRMLPARSRRRGVASRLRGGHRGFPRPPAADRQRPVDADAEVRLRRPRRRAIAGASRSPTGRARTRTARPRSSSSPRRASARSTSCRSTGSSSTPSTSRPIRVSCWAEA